MDNSRLFSSRTNTQSPMSSVMNGYDLPDWALTLVDTLMKALKERDAYTYGHCQRVSRLSKFIAKASGASEEEVLKIEYASLLHDIGKIGVPDSVLLKPSRLSPDEEAIMREHPVKSAEILRPLAHIPFFNDILPSILHHHERVDGVGYPQGLFGSRIPLGARIILIADTFDAMTTTRPYRKGLPIERAYAELTKYSGRQFDTDLVQVFLKAHPSWSTPTETQEATQEAVPDNVIPLPKAA